VIDIIIPTCKSYREIADQVRDMLQTADTVLRIVPTCRGVSAACNRNIGLEAATADIVIMVDDDVSGFPPMWDLQLVSVLRSNPQCVMVSARLMNPDGSPGPMLRLGPPTKASGLTVAKDRALVTACCAFRNDGLRFDENFLGSGFEDDDYSAQLREKYPGGTFLVNEDVRVVHHNTMTNQGFIKGQGPVPGGNFEKNRAYYEEKWRTRP
jgi:GT2 family glycosyltransferase